MISLYIGDIDGKKFLVFRAMDIAREVYPILEQIDEYLDANGSSDALDKLFDILGQKLRPRTNLTEPQDQAPYCQFCNAREARFCTCGPLARND